ncbi:claudin-like protein ZF-A89 [Esox lucius]|uniref:claudin-like protein ZF-A89 n=1 Tax=Esox lucius TaxID=8010 RepID=UPI000577C721|nr:claudin-like protein ZF-A89 [Esox lucius]
MGHQILAFILAFIGFIGTIVICALPMWKVTAFIGANIITAQVFWEGLWMVCVMQSTGQMQCKAYDSFLALPQYQQASRALICFSIGVSVLAIGLTVVGARCTNFLRDDWPAKEKAGIAAGAMFIVAGLLCLIPVSWSAANIIQGFYNPLATQESKGELGASIYVGWVSGVLLVIGGGMLCSTYRC